MQPVFLVPSDGKLMLGGNSTVDIAHVTTVPTTHGRMNIVPTVTNG
jgi:hypothetical protein